MPDVAPLHGQPHHVDRPGQPRDQVDHAVHGRPAPAAVLGAFFATSSLVHVASTLLEKRRAARRVHAVTNKRVLVLDPSLSPPLVEIDPQRLAFVVGFESREGWGDVDIQYRAEGTGRDDPEEILTFQGVPEIDVASNAIERLAFEHGNDIAEPLRDDEDEDEKK